METWINLVFLDEWDNSTESGLTITSFMDIIWSSKWTVSASVDAIIVQLSGKCVNLQTCPFPNWGSFFKQVISAELTEPFTLDFVWEVCDPKGFWWPLALFLP